MSLKRRIGVFLVRIGAIVLVSGLLLLLPGPHTGELVPFKNAIVSLLAVITIGIVLYDTFFYNRSRW
jgi:fumarate reductase subunit C